MARVSEPAYDPVKRVIDVVVARSPASSLSAPLQAVVAVLVRRKLGSPVLFRQPRPGRDERDLRAGQVPDDARAGPRARAGDATRSA